MKVKLVFPKCLFWLLVVHLHQTMQEGLAGDRLQHPFMHNVTTADNKIDISEYEEIHFGRKRFDENDSLRGRQYDRELLREEPSNNIAERDLEEEEMLPNLWPRALALESSPTISLSRAYDKDSSSHQPNNTEVLAQVGGTATLSCFTGHISDEVVTWLKRQDDKLLTIGQEVYGNEDRFSASLSHTTKAWELFVKEVQLSDAGQYECQLTTHPPYTFFFTLKVKQAKAFVTDPREVHIEEGSQLALQCQVQEAPFPPIYIFWYHNGTMVNYERKRDLHVHHENFTSSLVVAKVTSSDAGKYTCEPHLATSADVIVHVVTGEKPRAMQHEINDSGASGGISGFSLRQFASLSLFLSSYLLLFLPSLVVASLNVFYASSTSFEMIDVYSRRSIKEIKRSVTLK